METYLPLSLFIMIIGLGIAGYSAFLIYKTPKSWFMLVPMFAWALNLFLLYAFITISTLDGASVSAEVLRTISIWSVIQRLHGAITVVFMLYLITIECKQHG